MEILSRTVEQLLGRASGPLHFRLIVMPTMVTILAIQAGLRDARTGQPAFLHAFIRNPDARGDLLRSAAKDVGRVFIFALVIDTIYQVLQLRAFYVGQALVVALACAIVPYVLIRGPATRAARLVMKMVGAKPRPRRGEARRSLMASGQGVLPLWMIPMLYTGGSVLCGLVLPRLEATYLPTYTHPMSAAAALSFFGSVSSGMMALTGIVFSIIFVMVQFSAMAYSPRLVIVFSSDPSLFHTLGLFFATFSYALVALAWTDRGGSGSAPFFSSMAVIVLLIASMLTFARMLQRLTDLQIDNVLHLIGDAGRTVILDLFRDLQNDATPADIALPALGSAVQTLAYSGRPRPIARLDVAALVRMAQAAGAVIVVECAVGETLIEGSVMLHVHGAAAPLPELALRRCVLLARSRTFEQDPKYAIRLLVDIAIRALSSAINDPTTVVQALDQIEDLMRRLGRSELEAGQAHDATGALRLIFPMPTWQDYLTLSFDEIRQFGASSVQVIRRMRAALVGLQGVVATNARREAVGQYLRHLNLSVEHSAFDAQDQAMAQQEDRQGLGLSHRASSLPPGR